MSVESLCRRVTEFGFSLLGADFALDAKQHKVERLSASRRSLSWTRENSDGLVLACPSGLNDYISLLERRDYSYLMHDGGIIQVSIMFDNLSIQRHRLNFHPCPFLMSGRNLASFDGGLVDYIYETIMDDVGSNVKLRSAIRFDYAPLAAANSHPASHITINDARCRIPVRCPMSFDTFVRFILENFYPEVWANQQLRGALVFDQEPECLADDDRSRAHMSWEHR